MVQRGAEAAQSLRRCHRRARRAGADRGPLQRPRQVSSARSAPGAGRMPWPCSRIWPRRRPASAWCSGIEVCNRYETHVVNTARQALALVDDIGADNVMIHLDTYHMNIEEDDLVRPLRDVGDRLGYVHIGENHRGLLGSGHIDFTGFLPHPRRHRLPGSDHLRIILLGGGRAQPFLCAWRSGAICGPMAARLRCMPDSSPKASWKRRGRGQAPGRGAEPAAGELGIVDCCGGACRHRRGRRYNRAPRWVGVASLQALALQRLDRLPQPPVRPRRRLRSGDDRSGA